MNLYQRLGKRALDVSAVSLLFPIWLPVLCMSGLWVLASMGRPIFFVQKRPGLKGKIFSLYKLRTMSVGSAQDVERLTRIGKILRSTSLDELPSLLNVLKGDMSLVGPRPLLIQYLDRYTQEQMHRHDVKPGLTGLAQISGRNLLSWDEKFDLDLTYVQKISFKLDFVILFRTVSKVFSRHGIGSNESVTMSEFTGSSRC